MVLLGANIDTTRFRPTANGYEIVDVATDPNRVEIEVQEAIGSLRLASVAG
jgi:hypothetical protein